MEPLCLELQLIRSGDGWKTSLALDVDILPVPTPATVADLKKRFELTFSIPTCIQELSIEGCALNDSTLLKEALRNGDVVKLSYRWEGDCAIILESYHWLQDFERSLHLSPVNENYQWRSDSTRELIKHVLREGILKRLRQCCFPWSRCRTQVNNLHFFTLGGFDLLLRVLDNISYYSTDEGDKLMLYAIGEFLLCLYYMNESTEVKEFMLSNTNCLTLCFRCFSYANEFTMKYFNENAMINLRHQITRSALALLYRYGCKTWHCDLALTG